METPQLLYLSSSENDLDEALVNAPPGKKKSRTDVVVLESDDERCRTSAPLSASGGRNGNRNVVPSLLENFVIVSSDDEEREIVPPETIEENSSKDKPEISTRSVDYIAFYDPVTDEILLEPPSNLDKTSSQDHDSSSGRESPQPSTSKGITKGKRGLPPTKKPRVSFPSVKSSPDSDASSQMMSSSEMKKEPESGSGSCNSSLFEPVTEEPAKTVMKTRQQRNEARKTLARKRKNRHEADSSSSEDEEVPVRKKRRNRRNVKDKVDDGRKLKRKRIKKVSSSEIESSDNMKETEKKTSEDSQESSEGESQKTVTRRSLRSRQGADSKSKAFEDLVRKREARANKPKLPTPERVLVSGKESESEESSSSSGESPVPIVDESSADGTDFTGSDTPSSSSVTSSGVESEVPDLEIGGSDGEKDVPEGPVDSDYDDGVQPGSCSSSSIDETPDDGQNDHRCILCKNLGSTVVLGRAESANTPWCKCGHCQIFNDYVQDYDLVCCREIKTIVDFLEDELDDSSVCVTQHPRFTKDVLEYEGYARSVTKHQAPRRFSNNRVVSFYENYTCGKGDYRAYERALRAFKLSPPEVKMEKSLKSFIHWIFDQDVGKYQMPIPACVQAQVRSTYGNEIFSPFYPQSQCSDGNHCKDAARQEEDST